MTIQVPSPKKSKAQLAMERAIAGADSISLTLRRAMDSAGKALTQEAGVTQLSQISPALGDMTSGAFWALDDQGRPRMVMSAESLFELLGVSAYFAGFDENMQPQFWMDADTGAAVFARRLGVIDENGLTIYGLTGGGIRLEDTGGHGRIFLRTQEDALTPSLRFLWWSEEQSQLLINEGFETGDLTGWTVESGTIAVVEGGHNAGYCAQLTGDITGNSAIASTRFDLSPTYRKLVVSGLVKTPGALPVTVMVRSYDSGGSLITNEAAWYTIRADDEDFMSFVGCVTVPDNAVKASVWIGSTGSPSSLLALVDDVSVKSIESYTQFGMGSEGLVMGDNTPLQPVLSWGASAGDGPSQNRNVGSTYTTQIMVLEVFETLRVTGVKWDVRTAGGYQLHKLYGPNITSSIRQLWSGTVAAPGEVTMTFSRPEVLTPGTYYLGLTSTGGAVSWWDYNNNTWLPSSNPDFRLNGIYYNTTAFASYVPGARLIRGRGVWA